jgi:hypothetical protein
LRYAITGDLDVILLHVLSVGGGNGWIRESGGEDESAGGQRSDGKSVHDWTP